MLKFKNFATLKNFANFARFISLFVVLQLNLMCLAATPKWGDLGCGVYRNPIINADFSDPDVIRVGDKYYMVASDFHFMGMQMLESDDLVNWHYVSHVYDALPFAEYDVNQRYGGGSWAPSLRYHDGEFWVYFCTPHEGLFMAKSKSPSGPWSPLRLVKEVEKWEDPCPLWDEDGQAYLCHSLYGAGPIIMHRMSNDGTMLLDDGVVVYEGPVAEGPKLHKINNKYYISLPEGGVRGGWQTVLRSDALYGPYERMVVLEQGSTGINGPHQGALVDTPDGQWWFVHFQETDALGRVVHLPPVRWSDGWPLIGVDIDGTGVGRPVEIWAKPIESEPSLSDALATSDDFDSGELSLQWQWNHNACDSAWSLLENPGQLTLKALKSSNFKNARNTLTQKAMGESGVVTTAMITRNMAEGQRSGLACMGKGNRMLGVKVKDGKKWLYISNDTTEQLIAVLADPLQPVYLRLKLDVKNRKYQWLYSYTGKDYFKAGDAFYLRWGNWKGVRPALYTYNVDGDQGEAQFMWFDYSHDGNCRQKATVNKAFDLTSEQAIVDNIALTHFNENVVVVDIADINTDNTARKAIQRAIDECSASGGGTVMVGAGLYEIDGNIVLKSNVNLHIDDFAILSFSGDANDFLPPVLSRWEGTELYNHSPMIYAINAVNIAITGGGVIDGQAGKEMAGWAEREVRDRDRLRAQGEDLAPLSKRVYGKGTVLRPTCVEFIGCSRILIEDVTIANSPFWTIHPVYCDNVIVRGVTIDSHYANNDGCDPDSSSNVLIENCCFNVGDDAIAIKSGRDADGRRVGRPSENIVIRNCVFNSECNGLCIGSEMSGGVSNVYMHDICIGTVKNAIYFKSNRDRGGYIRNVHVSDITVNHTLGAVLRFETNYFGFRGGNHATQYEDFYISNVVAEKSDNFALFISGYPEKPVRNVFIDNMIVRSAAEPYYLYSVDNVTLDNVSVNGAVLPEHPQPSATERILDVW